MDKVISSVDEVIADIPDGAVIAIGGFFACGVPRALLQGLIKKGVKDLRLITGCGAMLGASEELTQLVKNKQISVIVDSYGLFRSARKGQEDQDGLP